MIDIKEHNRIMNTIHFMDVMRNAKININEAFYLIINNASYFGTKEEFYNVHNSFHDANILEATPKG